AVLPTGGGKSLLYQLPALYLGGVTVVVSPLIALMDDQVGQLHRRGITAFAWHSGKSFSDQQLIQENLLRRNEPMLLYVSPERLETEAFLSFVARIPVRFLAVDEAHCISQWGHDFRPAYRHILKFREIFPKLPLIALTATATAEVEKDIITQLNLTEPNIFRQSIYKPNLGIYVREETDKIKFLVRHIQHLQGSGIVYIRNRKNAEEIAQTLSNYGFNGMYYHAGLSAEERQMIQDKWLRDKYRFVVATNAFGMGIDKSDVRWIIHVAPVSSVEEYYQEIGRAGRDGLPAKAYMLWNEEDFENMHSIIDIAFPSEEMITYILRRFVHYFQLPKGRAVLSQRFNMEELGKVFEVSIFQIHSVLSLLMKMGVLEYQEPILQEGEVEILINSDEMLQIRLQYPRLFELIDYWVRRVDNAFGAPIKVETENLMENLGASKKDIIQRLEALHRYGFVSYKPEGQYGIVRFPHGRPDLQTIEYDMELVKSLKERQLQGVRNMQKYIDEDECRFRFLQQYFGEKTRNICSHCDLFYQSQALKNNRIARLADRLWENIPENGMDLSEYIVLQNNEYMAQAVIRHLYRQQKIVYSSDKIYRN
ncbi:MAG TPA: RecQ family ATP-dependent DNA helicase, partial [Membranihabitans sp.]|nr:RecQ family ATP-dependent DNA helicase [Membranihabitans sp.]